MLVDRILKRGESAEARVDAGDGQARRRDLAGGLEELGKAVALNPELPGVHSLYGRALLETGNRDRPRPSSKPSSRATRSTSTRTSISACC